MSKNKNKKRYEVNAIQNNNENNKVDNQNNEISVEEESNALEVTVAEEIEEPGGLYWVRLDWNDPETQIFMGYYDDCVEEANKHPGYKVFNDLGIPVYENLGSSSKEEDDDKNVLYNYLLPSTGKLVVLKGVPVYRRPNDIKPFREANGKYYFYDYTIINDRAKITENANIANDPNRNPSMIYGYIDIKQKRN